MPNKELAKITPEEIKEAVSKKLTCLYVSIEKQPEYFVEMIEINQGMSKLLDPEIIIGLFEYDLNTYYVIVGEDVLLNSKDNNEGCYDIWKIIKIVENRKPQESGKMVMKYMSSTCFLPEDK